MRIIRSLTLSFIFCLQRAMAASGNGISMATQLADSYLRSFPFEEAKPAPKIEQDKKRPIHATDIHLSPREERVVVFNEIFAKSKLYQAQYKEMHTVLNQYAWNDLHLFCGTSTTPAYHFLARINKTITTLGEGALASLLAAPLANLPELTKRQQLIRFLDQEPQARNILKQELQNYKSSEKHMLSFWAETDPLYTKEYNKYLTKLFYTNSAASNKNATSLQMRKLFFRDFGGIYWNAICYPLTSAILGVISVPIYNVFNDKKQTYKDYYSNEWPQSIPVWNFFHINNQYKSGKHNNESSLSVCKYVLAGWTTLHSFWQYYQLYRNYKEYAGVLRNLALRMADVQTFLNTAKKINVLVQNNSHLEALYGPQLTSIRTLLARPQEPSEAGHLLRYLEELPFRSWNYLFHNAGKLLASYKLFVEHKAIFHDAMYELGQLDAFLSVSTLMDETRAMGAPHAYAFTKFLSPEQYGEPRLMLADMWSPMLDPKEAVGNDVIMDEHTRHIILTGPNAGGKSTFLTGVTQAILLSQAFGIAPARSFEMTPFHKINTYIDITDDIAAGKSLFMAEVCRFQDHLNLLKPLKAEEFSFSIFDEPFSGTNPTEGAAAEYSVLNDIAKYKNTFNMVATHYPIVMLLEKNEPTKGFKNYKVFIKHKGAGEKIDYTYKVIPGESNQAIAIDILEEQGYASEMLTQARDIIKNPQKYKKSFSEKK